MAQVAAYRARYRCILIDNRGAGQSETPATGYTVRRMADDAAELLRTLGVGAAHISGHSLGAAIAQELAINHPRLVATLQLHSTWDRTASYPHLEHQLVFRQALARRELWDLLAANTAVGLLAPAYVNAQAADVRQRIAFLEANHPSAHGLVGHYQAALDHDTRGRLGTIQAPTLVTGGTADLVTLPAYGQAVQAQIADARWHPFEGAGHLPISETPEAFNRVTLAFLAEQALSL
jgi:pimeloyl-ACP methyl ester carboxylesterase